MRQPIREKLKAPFLLSVVLVGIMATQSVLGLTLSEMYRDVEWIRATWFGNDLVTLVLGVPLLAVALLLTRRGAVRGILLWLGLLGFGAYNYAFYLFGAALNAFFLFYVVALLLAVVGLILALSHLPVANIAAQFTPRTPVRLIGGYLTFVALGLAVVWIALWASHTFGGRPLPVEADVFKVVASLDLVLMVPVLASGGILLWRRHPWGYMIASIAGIQGALYLTVLSINSVVGIIRGLIEPPGELPIWGTLALATIITTSVLLANVQSGERGAGEAL